ncbi:MAG: hypothetical protein PVI41_06345 [Roseobacter sp.]|jgi:hypothetical protein
MERGDLLMFASAGLEDEHANGLCKTRAPMPERPAQGKGKRSK